MHHIVCRHIDNLVICIISHRDSGIDIQIGICPVIGIEQFLIIKFPCMLLDLMGPYIVIAPYNQCIILILRPCNIRL